MMEKSSQVVEHLFRTEYGKLVAIITGMIGSSHIQLAEDIVQETLISAIHSWGIEGIPPNPTGWLVLVAKRKALNEIKRNKIIQEHHLANEQKSLNDEINPIFLDDEIEDSQLRMIFTCCHPSLNMESQIALILKTLCGFGIKEVAHALLTNESTINKRLYRAKTSIRESQLPFEIPYGIELTKRLDTVCTSLYLFFNEGYNSKSNDSLIRKELCLEAIRLTKLLVNHFKETPKLSALLALMCFHAARFEARIDNRGTIVLFEDQDRSLWNQDLIQYGIHYLSRSMTDKSLSSYHIEAYIAAEHCTASSFETTNWKTIYDNYLLLEKIKPTPIIKLNLAIIRSKLDGKEHSLSLLDNLTKDKVLNSYHLLPATQGVFHMQLGNYERAIEYLEKAVQLKPPLMEMELIQNKILTCKKMLPTS